MPCIKCREFCAQLSLACGSFQTPEAHGPDINFLLAAQTSLLAPTYSLLGSKSRTPSPWKLSRYLVTEGGTQSSLAHSITHRLGSVGIEFKKKQKVIFNFKENPRYLYTVNI